MVAKDLCPAEMLSSMAQGWCVGSRLDDYHLTSLVLVKPENCGRLV